MTKTQQYHRGWRAPCLVKKRPEVAQTVILLFHSRIDKSPVSINFTNVTNHIHVASRPVIIMPLNNANGMTYKVYYKWSVPQLGTMVGMLSQAARVSIHEVF